MKPPVGELPRTVADAAFDVMRRRGLTTIFSNPGSTEVPFLAKLPDDIEFVLGLHEASVVAMAAGYALARSQPALALLHTTAGLGNAVGALATARVNRAPLVVIVGQQDRRHLALEPFLAGRLEGLAGDYPLDVITPARAADVPSAIGRAAHTAGQGNGPVLVIVPMGDWDEEADPTAQASAAAVGTARCGAPEELDDVAAALAGATSPAILAAAGNDTAEGWAAAAALAEHLGAAVWIEPFGSRVAFDQTHPNYAGQLPADRPRLRAALEGTDVLLVLGGPAIRQYPYKEGDLLPAGVRAFVLTADPHEANRSPVELALIGDPAFLAQSLLERLKNERPEPKTGSPRQAVDIGSSFRLPTPQPGEPLRAAHVFELLAKQLPADTVIVEESPSSRPALQALVPVRTPGGYLSAAMGGLGFALPAAIGLRLGLQRAAPGRARPVVAVIGDGSSLYSIQGLWSAAQLGVGVVFIVLANGGYAIMDRLAEQRDSKPAWPPFPEISVHAIAGGFGVTARRIEDYTELVQVLDDVCATLGERTEPLVLEIAVVPDKTFNP